MPVIRYVLLCLLLAPYALAGTPPSDRLPADAGPWVVRAYFANKAQLNQLTRRTAPWEVRHEQGFAVVEVANRYEYARLIAEGFALSIDPALSSILRQPHRGLASVPGYACYRTVEETYASMDALVVSHPNLASIVDIGDTWNKIHHPGSGYDLRVLKLGNSAIAGSKPRMFVVGAIHSREYSTAETVMRFAEDLLARYASDADVRWILDQHEVYLLPHANPDGRKKAELGQLWRKNLNESYCTVNPGQRGADLNRNFPFEWGAHNGSSDEPCDDIFRGGSAGSESETSAVIDYLRTLFPDVRPADLVTPAPAESPGVFVDVHSYGKLVMWPWSFSADPAPNGPAMATLGRRLAWFNGYKPQPGVALYVTDGGSKDFAYGDLGVPAISLELGEAFFESCASFEGKVLGDNLRALQYLLRTARRPYQEPAGPSLRDVRSAPVEIGEPIRLVGTASDADFNSSNGSEATQTIAQVAAFSGASFPWSGVVADALASPADGAFDSAEELFIVKLASAGLGLGAHRIMLRASDSQSAGPSYAQQVEVVATGSTALLSGEVRDANSAALIAIPAQVRLGDFGSLTQASSGSRYAMRAPSGSYTLQVSASGYAPTTIPAINLSAPDQVIQDVLLSPICSLFSDQASAGLANFNAQAPWGLDTEHFVSAPAAFTDSPSGDYAANSNVALTMVPLDLRDSGHVRLKFQSYCDTEAGFDFGRVEVSTDGSLWNEVWRCDANAAWLPVDLDLGLLNGASNAQIRFRLTSDSGVQRDGWSIDDIQIEGTGALCGGVVDGIFADSFD